MILYLHVTLLLVVRGWWMGVRKGQNEQKWIVWHFHTFLHQNVGNLIERNATQATEMELEF